MSHLTMNQTLRKYRLDFAFSTLFYIRIRLSHAIVHVVCFSRLFLLTCSLCTSSSLSIMIYARLFDIGYYQTRDVLFDALLFIQQHCSSLMPNNTDRNAPNMFLHKILFEFFTKETSQPSLKYLENLLVTYSTMAQHHDDILRCFLLVCRQQTWIWCSKELCTKLLLPLIHRIDRCLPILILLQHILVINKDNDQFQQDANFRDHVKQMFLLRKILNHDESIVRDRIFFILHTCT
jgi:hypothetical protein